MKSNHMKKIKELRKEKKLSQKEIAAILNITQKAYSNYETGAREPSIETLIMISDYYNVSLDYIVGNETKKYYKLNEEERLVLNKYNKLTEKNKGKIEHYLEQLNDEQTETTAIEKEVI